VINVILPDFSFSAGGQMLTIPAGQAGMLPITLTSLNNVAGTAALTCAAGPVMGYSCTMQPNSVTLTAGQGATSSIVLTPTLGTSSSAVRRAAFGSSGGGSPPFSGQFPGSPTLLVVAGVLLLLAGAAKGNRLRAATALGVVCIFCWSNGCGGSGSSSAPAPPQPSSGPTTTTLTITPGKLSTGDMATVIATVSGPDSPTGTVSFVVDGRPFQTNPLVSGATTVSVQPPVPGFLSVQAMYSGDSHNAASSSAVVNALVTGTGGISVTGTVGPTQHVLLLNFTLQ
jgi:hypothetical protein